jgi:hypothetical protein
MARDLQDIPPAPSAICVLVGDRFDVLRGLVECNGDVESGCLEPFKLTQNYKAYLLNVDTPYYSTQIQVLFFDTLSEYKQWQGNVPLALFICIDVNESEAKLKESLEQLNSLDLDKIETRVLVSRLV